MFVFQRRALKSFCVSGGMPGHSRPMLFLESVIFRNAGNHKHDAESDYERDVKMGEAALSLRN